MTGRLSPAILAVDIGASKTLVSVRRADALHDLEAPVARFATPHDPDAAIDAILAVTEAMAPGSTLATGGSGPIAAACIVAPGPLDRQSGRVIGGTNLGWAGVPLAGPVSAAIGAPVVLEDDATAAALGEAIAGAGHGADPFAYLTISSGIGAGIVAGGRSIAGAGGAAGEVGHLVIDPAGPRCPCGRRGCIEAYAGGAAIARRARGSWPSGRLADGRPAPRDAAAVFALAEEGDPDAARLVEEAALALGHGIAAIAAIIDPAVIAVGGAIGLGQRVLVRRATVVARARLLPSTARSLRVVPAALGERSALEGAAILAARRLAG